MDALYNQFFTTWNGRFAEAEDPSNLYQCFDLAFLWCDALKIPREAIRHQFAREIWEQPNDLTRQYFDLIPNSLTNIPQKGDIIVFNTKVGPAGHVDIDTGKSNVINSVSFAQNWGSPTYCREVTHYFYYGCYGFLRPKPQINPDDQLVVNLQQLFNSGGSSTTKIATDITLLKQAGKI